MVYNHVHQRAHSQILRQEGYMDKIQRTEGEITYGQIKKKKPHTQTKKNQHKRHKE